MLVVATGGLAMTFAIISGIVLLCFVDIYVLSVIFGDANGSERERQFTMSCVVRLVLSIMDSL